MLIEKLHLEDDEEVLQTFRKHWWNIVANLSALLMLAIAPLVLISAAGAFESTLNTTLFSTIGQWFMTHEAVTLYIYSFWLLGLLIAFGNFWTDQYLDVWVVTNKRVVLVDQRGFFHRFVSSFRLERLQDMNIEVKGVIPTLLDFGTIEAQTAGGSNEEFIGHMLPHPRDIKALIVEAADKLTESQSQRIANLKNQSL